MTVISKFAKFSSKHPILRGMMSYAVLYPTSNLIQQTLAGKRFDNYDWMQIGRFALYGTFFTAPTFYAYVRLANIIWPQTNWKTAIKKALLEQLLYDPPALVCFYFGMCMLEGKSVEDGTAAVKTKFLPSYQVGLCVWPVLQTINYSWIKEKNRVPFTSVCSLVWCCFLSYMHQLEMKKQELQITNPPILLPN